MTPMSVTFAAQAAAPQGPDFGVFLMFGSLFAIFYFLVLRPQQKQRRELENAVRRAVALESDSLIQPDNLPEPVRTGRMPTHRLGTELQAQLNAAAGMGPAGAADAAVIPAAGLDLEERLEEVRRVYMRRALEEAGGVQKKAAEKLGMSFRSFRYYMDKLGLKDDTEATE